MTATRPKTPTNKQTNRITVYGIVERPSNITFFDIYQIYLLEYGYMDIWIYTMDTMDISNNLKELF